MSNRSICIAVMLFFLVGGMLGLGGRPEAPEPDISRSRSVKIERPEKDAPPDKAPAQPAETKKASPETGEGPSEKPVALLPEGAEPKARGLDDDDTVHSAEKELGELMISEQEALFGEQERLYTRQGRVDPFEPFLRKPEPETSSDSETDIEQRRVPQTPLEKVALSQLKLTAILRLASEKNPIAMVEDPAGKGYVVKKGTWIGDQGGQIAEILSDRIVVQEQYKDVFGKIAVREIEKKLQN
jgi:Tfp pilus assembly protein PilP